MVLSELSYMIKHTKKFAKKKKVHTPLSQFHAVSYRQPGPYGNVLIMSPWNYPFLLTIDPLVNAIAAGNTIVVKPSAYSPATGNIVKEIIEECFDAKYVAVVMGGRKENETLLDKKFNMIFFTGSQSVGKEVLRRASEKIIPVVLELGGKSPCIIDDSCNLKLAATRLVFGKYLNCGQTCVAPDYVMVDEKIKVVLDALGIERGVIQQDRNFYNTWINDWNITEDLLNYAITVSSDKFQPMQFLNKVLAKYHTSGVTTIDEAKKVEINFGAKIEKTGTTKARESKKRDYTKDELNSLFTVLKEVEL